MDRFLDKLLIVLSIFAVIWFTWIVCRGIHYDNQKDLACEKLDFENYKFFTSRRSYIGETGYCEDNENNIHYVRMDCKPWYWTKCTAKLISAGDVKVQQK